MRLIRYPSSSGLPPQWVPAGFLKTTTKDPLSTKYSASLTRLTNIINMDTLYDSFMVYWLTHILQKELTISETLVLSFISD